MRISPSGNVRRPIPGSPSGRITIRLRTPPKNTRRIDIAPSGKDSRIIRVKPATRYPVSDLSGTMPTLSAEELYNFLSEMGLHRISSLLRKADLGETIINTGPVTIFAPTDEAFSLVPHETLEELKNDPKKLKEFLLNHMTKGHIKPQDVRNDATVASLQSSLLRFNIYNQGQVITVSGAKFLDSGQTVGWTMIQPIDRVLQPVSRINLVDRSRVSYPKMHSYLVQCGLSEQLASGTFTLFAPTDEAFKNLPEKAQDIIFSNSTLLRKVVLNHVVPGAFFSTVFTNGFELRSLGGDPLTFTTSRGLILVNGIPILKPDVEVTNGVIHELNRVLIPPEVAEMCRCIPMYSTAPATVQPWPTFPVTHSEVIPFGTKIKPPFHPPASHAKIPVRVHTDVQLSVGKKHPSEPEPTVPSHKQPVVVSFSKRKQVQVPISQVLTDPMDLPDGTRATFTTANHLFKKSLLINRFRHPRPYTLILPTDEAFTRLSPNTLGRLEGNGKLLRRVLLCHVIDTRIAPESLQNNGRVETLGGPLVVNIQNGSQLMIGGGNILSIQPVTNGIVYVTNRVTFPLPQPAVDHILHDPNLANDVSIWSKIVSNSGLQPVLKGPNVYTMFVPSNAAFERFPQHVLEQLYQNKNLLRDLVSSHVVQGAYFKNMITQGMVLRSLNGKQLRFGLISDGFLVNEAPVQRPGVITGNGVVYVISSLLYEPTPYRSLEPQPSGGMEPGDLTTPGTEQDIMEIGRSHNATAFLRWMKPTGFLDVIQAGGRYTLFLPTNSAMSSLSPTLRLALTGNPRQRRKMIQYHISPLSVVNLDITNELLLQTLLPTKPVRCNVYHMGKVVTINGGPIVKMIPKENLTVVIVNRTLTPPVGDLFLTVSKSPMLRNFTKIIKVAEMEEEIKSDGPYTLFAPSKCAFSRLSPEEYEHLIQDRTAAKEFVLRHLVKGSIYTSGVKDGMKFTSQYPSPLNIRVLPTCITVNDVKIKYGDISATNGVLHIVAEVL